MEHNIILGYDILTFNGPIPNCLPYHMVPTIKEASNYDFSMSGEFFQKKHGEYWPIFNSNFFDYSNDSVVKSVYEIRYERIYKKNSQKWFYIIEPFGSLDPFFGNTENFNIPIIYNIPKETLDEIKNGNGNILINYIIDGGIGIKKENFLKLKKYFDENDIPDQKIYLIFQDFKLNDYLKKIGANYNFLNFNMALLSKSKEFYNTISNPEFTYWNKDSIEPQVGQIEAKKSSIQTIQTLKNFLNGRNDFNKKIFDEINPKKDFLFFCRHIRVERLLILDFLYKRGEDKSFYSWSKKFMNESKNIIKEFEEVTKNSELANKFLNEDRILDVPDITKIAGYGFEDSSLYNNSFLSIVGESVFFQKDEDFKSGYLSEKIWKPIGHCHPFVIVGPSKSLQYLKELGFKTFSPYIDESYDDIEDDTLRLVEIFKVLENFGNQSIDQKYEFLNKIFDILEYNYNYFLSIKQYESVYRKKYIEFFFKKSKLL